MRILARPARHEGGFFHQIVVIAGMSVLCGVLIAGLILPWAGLLGLAAKKTSTAVEEFPKELTFHPLNERTVVLAENGRRIATFYDENRIYVPLSKISPNMKSALIAIEDARFYEHGAIDVKGTLRALIVNQASDDVVQGGSSITQQLVKLTLQENATTAAEREAASAKNFARKIDELRYAVWVEQHLTKDRILEHYLNTAYFGDGAYGIESAARHYFSTTAAKLNLRQAALLAGIVKNPTRYDPTNFAREALSRRNTVLDVMLKLHKVDSTTASKVRATKLGLKVDRTRNGCLGSPAEFFCDYLRRYLMQDQALGRTAAERERRLYAGGLTIKTTVNLKMQRAAEAAALGHVNPTDNAIGALAMVEPGTGYVRALAQSRPMGPRAKNGETFLNYIVNQKYGDSGGFQAGSTFKVFVLAQAIKDGIPLNFKIKAPDQIRLDENQYRTCGGYYRSTGVWEPVNSTGSGTFDLYQGTRQSVNTFFAQLELMTGICKPWNLAQEMGLQLDESSRVPSFTLGVAYVSPLEMAEAYATFPARGLHCDSTPILEIRDRKGRVMPTPGPQCQRVMAAPVADAVNDILRGVQEPGGFGYDNEDELSQPSAAKTGTIQFNKAVWFIGYTPNLATAAMIAGANRQGHEVTLNYQTVGDAAVGDNAYGSTLAGPMWRDAMRAIEDLLPDVDFHAPDLQTIEGQQVDIPSFYGDSPSDAASQLTKLGFNPVISSLVSSSAPYGTVAYTTPSGEGVTGQIVTIYISDGSPYVPPAPPKTTQPPPTTEPPGKPRKPR